MKSPEVPVMNEPTVTPADHAEPSRRKRGRYGAGRRPPKKRDCRIYERHILNRAERFAVIIDAKVRRRGYTLGTDDRLFCEYAKRHTRELALSGIDKVYFAVVGHGFRQADLDKLAGFMSGTPIRSVVFLEVDALMKLVNDSIRDRRQFRLDDLDRLLFGNKIISRDGDEWVVGRG